MADLLSLMKRDIRVVQLSEGDSAGRSDALNDFRRLVLESEDKYPDIANWIDNRVIRELHTGSRRIAVVAYEKSTPAAAAVLKLGRRTKLCHLKVAPAHEGALLGDLLFSVLISHAAPIAESLHFTLPESLWASRGQFFRSFGFAKAGPAFRRYRGGDPEMVCSAGLKDIWSSVLGKLPKIANSLSASDSDSRPSMMLSIKPKFAESILEGKKGVEVRTRFSHRWTGHRASIYATSPVRALVGEMLINGVEADTPERIWRNYQDQLGCSWDEFHAYTRQRKQVYAIMIGSALPYACPVPFAESEGNKLSPPQAYCRLLQGSPVTRMALFASLTQVVSRSDSADQPRPDRRSHPRQAPNGYLQLTGAPPPQLK